MNRACSWTGCKAVDLVEVGAGAHQGSHPKTREDVDLILDNGGLLRRNIIPWDQH
jgi:hypothetical protein